MNVRKRLICEFSAFLNFPRCFSAREKNKPLCRSIIVRKRSIYTTQAFSLCFVRFIQTAKHSLYDLPLRSYFPILYIIKEVERRIYMTLGFDIERRDTKYTRVHKKLVSMGKRFGLVFTFAEIIR